MIKRLSRSVREYWLTALLSPVCMIGEVYMETRIPAVLSKIVDFGVERGDMTAVVQYGLLLILCALCSLGFGVRHSRPHTLTDDAQLQFGKHT